VLITFLAVLIFATVSAEAAPTFGATFLFPDNILADPNLGITSGVFLDIGVNAINDPNGVASAAAVPSQAGLGNINLFPQGGVFNAFWSNLVPLPPGIQAGTQYTIFATNTLNQTSSVLIGNAFTPLPPELVPVQHIAYGSVSGMTAVSWDRVFVAGTEVSSYQVRISNVNPNGTIGTTFFTVTLPVDSVALTSTRAQFLVPNGVVTIGQNVEFSITAEITNSQNVILDRSRNFAPATTILQGGTSQSFPILPGSSGILPGGGRYSFVNVPSGLWFDPATAAGFHYVMESPGSLFTQILNFPTGFASPFEVFSGGIDLGSFGAGDHLVFPGGGVSEFTITGINPLVDPNNPNAFPLQLQFSTSIASFEMIALVPGPATSLLLILGFASGAAFSWGRSERR